MTHISRDRPMAAFPDRGGINSFPRYSRGASSQSRSGKRTFTPLAPVSVLIAEHLLHIVVGVLGVELVPWRILAERIQIDCIVDMIIEGAAGARGGATPDDLILEIVLAKDLVGQNLDVVTNVPVQ